MMLSSSSRSGASAIAASSRCCSASLTRGLRTQSAPLARKSAAGASLLRSQQLLPQARLFSRSALALDKVQVPQMAESITEGTLKQWIKKAGDYVKEGEEIATIETDKIDVSVNATVSGTITETYSEEEDTVTVGKDLCNIEPGDAPAEGSSSGGESKKEEKKPEPKEEKKPEPKKEEQSQSKEQEKKGGESAPKKGEEPQNKSPTESSKQASSSSSSSKPAPKQSTPEPKEAAQPGSRNERRVKMSRMRMRIAERLKQSQNTAASLTTFNEIDMSNLMAFRARHKDRILKQEGVKLGFMSAFAKASALALQDIPAANATIEGDGLGDTIVYHDYVDLSVAVSTEKGLVTPVVRNLENMSLVQIEQEIAALGKKARDNKLTLEDMAGGTFTISNGGVFGSLFGTPILNLPGSAILGMHAINDKPWVVNGKVEIRPIMVVALTYDHRLLDGREAVTFLVKLKQYIEDMPSMLL